MRSLRPLPLALLALGALAAEAQAQVVSRLPLEVHARAGAGLPTGGFAGRAPGIGAEPGAAFEVGALLRVLPWLGAYAAYQHERFGCGECAATGNDGLAYTTGFEAGGEVLLPAWRFGLRPWLRGGVARHTLRFTREESALASEPGTGFGLAGGVRVGVGALALAPGVRYQSYPVTVRFADFPERSLDVSHLTFDLGLIVPF